MQAFLSGGKRFASPMSRRNLSSSASHSEEKKGPSFADLINSKGKTFRSHSFRDHRDKFQPIQPPASLTVAMVMTDPPTARRAAQPRHDLAGGRSQPTALPDLRTSPEHPCRIDSAAGSVPSQQKVSRSEQGSTQHIPDQVFPCQSHWLDEVLILVDLLLIAL